MNVAVDKLLYLNIPYFETNLKEYAILNIINNQGRKKNIYNFNFGIELFRIILSFLIVVYHIHSKEKKSPLLNFSLSFLPFYTSSFFFMSFYLSFKYLASKNVITTKERLQRIAIPYIIWPIIIFLENNVYKYIYYHHKKYSIKDLIFQLVVGRKINDVFWFQFNLIYISIIIIIIIFIFSKKISFHILKLLAFLSMIIKYKNYDNVIFSKYTKAVSHSIGRLPTAFLFSINGFFLGSFNILYKIQQKQKVKILLLSVPLLLCFLREHKKIFKFLLGFNFLIFNILIIILFLFFSSLPLNFIFNEKYVFFVKKLTGFTGGI